MQSGVEHLIDKWAHSQRSEEPETLKLISEHRLCQSKKNYSIDGEWSEASYYALIYEWACSQMSDQPKTL
jgi:hypothetical protein